MATTAYFSTLFYATTAGKAGPPPPTAAFPRFSSGFLNSPLWDRLSSSHIQKAPAFVLKRTPGVAYATAATEKSIHDFTVKDIDGNDISLSKFKGKVLLIVNVASRCGLTNSNYTELSQLYQKYKTQAAIEKDLWACPTEVSKAQSVAASEAIPLLQYLIQSGPPRFQEKAELLLQCLLGTLTVIIKRGNNLRQSVGNPSVYCKLTLGSTPPRQTKKMDEITVNVQDAQSQNLHVIQEKDANECLLYNEIEEDGERFEPYGEDQETNTEFGDQNRLDDFSSAPHVGMEFPTDDAAYAFYNAFALKKGFSIRSYSTYKSRKKEEVTKRIFVCNKQGYKSLTDKRQEGKDVKRRRDEREGCMARLRVHKIENGVWVIKDFNDMHFLRAVIIGPAGTPYHDGLFFFDAQFPASYPNDQFLKCADRWRSLLLEYDETGPSIVHRKCF